MVFQNPSSQLFHLRCDDEVAFGVRNLGLPGEEVQRRVAWALSAVGLNGFEPRKPCNLSGGEKQRLAIATVLAMQSRILVLDEPMASLDVSGTHQVMRILKRLREQYGLTIVLIEHRLAEAVRLADRLVLMDGGNLVADGNPQEVLAKRGLLRRLGLRRPADTPADSWNRLLEANEIPLNDSRPILSINNVSAGYNGREVIKNVNFDLYAGEFVALVGDNGAGKSTLGLVAAGMIKPARGKVTFDGGMRPRGGRDVSLLFQDPEDQLFTDKVDDEVAFGPRNFGAFDYKLHEQILHEADLTTLRNHNPSKLSAGQQQRTTLASCFGLRPRVVILDEPTQGQDWGHLERLMEYLLLTNQIGTTVLLITHDFKLVHRYARRVILMKEGRIILDGRIKDRNSEHQIKNHL